MISDFAKLNYVFTLNPRENLDAFNIGNETRFANDPWKGKANVTADSEFPLNLVEAAC